MELKQHLKMVQQLRMTPQLQQAIKLLQLSKMELVNLVQKEMVENPVLEEAPEEQPDRVSVERLREREAGDGDNGEMNAEGSAEKAVKEIDWDAYLENYSSPLPANSYRGMQDDLPGPEATLSSPEGLTEHLLWQLNLNASCEDERRVGEEILGNLDDDGYLRGVTIEGIAERCEVDTEYAEGVLEWIQEFDPVGVAARDLRECLLVQARHYYPEEQVLHDVLDRHIPNLEKRKVKIIAKDLGVSVDQVIEAAKLMSTLDPYPGGAYSNEEAVYITPDVYVHKVGDEYLTVLNEDGMPKLRVSDYYRRALKSGKANEAKSYIQDKLRSAWWLIRSIHQRQRTIVRVTESIFRFQRDFLDRGVSELRPLVLRDVADDIGVHESTVSRVTTNKYVHTPQGIYELKYFFNSAIGCSDGTDTASESVKMRIKQIIAEEDSQKPLSDQKIADQLADEGIEIARRTVAKYREMLGILKSSQRKRLF
jgi:RNA polymerase sigma-54 factor